MKPAVSDPPEMHRRLWDGFTGDVGFDIGANCGQSVEEMLSRFKVVYSFEPAEECFPYLADIGSGRFSWLPIAVSNNDDVTELIALPDKIDTGQLVSVEAEGMEYNPRSADAVSRRVVCRQIDTLVNRGELPSPDFMKIDVEGHELLVLLGARKTLAIKRPAILLEFHAENLHTACAAVLESFDYAVETIRHPHYRPGTQLWRSHGWIRARQNT